MPLTIRTSGFEQFLNQEGGSTLKVLILGDPDAGKTRSSSFWPKPIIAACEDGLLSVADRGVPYAEIKSSADMQALLNMLKREKAKPFAARQYQTLVVDTLDAYQRVLVFERLRAEHKESLSGWTDWGYLDGKMQQLLEQIHGLGIHVVVNLHTKDERDGSGDDQILVRKARLKGDIKDAIWGEFDLIGLMDTFYQAEKGERVLKRHIRWHSEPRYPMLRDRSGRLPLFTEVDFTDQDFWRIFNTITAGVDALPSEQDLQQVETEDDEDVPPADTPGGPVKVAKLPLKKLPGLPAAKAAAKKAAVEKVAEVGTPAVPEPEPEPAAEPEPEPEPDPTPEPETSTDVEESKPELDEHQAAVDLVVEELEGEVLEEPVAEPTVKADNMCGFQPETHKHFQPGHPGCGKDLSGENVAKVNLALLRAKAKLCSSCMEEWKAQNVPA